jgi:hypothetical protein
MKTVECIPAVQSYSKRQYQLNFNIFAGHVDKILSCIRPTVTQMSTTITTTTATPTSPSFSNNGILIIISKIAAKGTKLKIAAQNMKQSGQSDSQLQFYKSNLYVQTDSCIL